LDGPIARSRLNGIPVSRVWSRSQWRVETAVRSLHGCARPYFFHNPYFPLPLKIYWLSHTPRMVGESLISYRKSKSEGPISRNPSSPRCLQLISAVYGSLLSPARDNLLIHSQNMVLDVCQTKIFSWRASPFILSHELLREAFEYH
jgi:hypothetical protein